MAKKNRIHQMDTKYPHWHWLFTLYMPNSDEALAEQIGISSKTIKRLRTGNYECSSSTEQKILDYLDRLCIKLSRLSPTLQVIRLKDKKPIW